MRTFQDKLALGLTLKGATEQVIDGGDIKRIDLHLTSWGWSGTIEFDIFDNGDETDTFLPSYFDSKLILIDLRIAGALSDKEDLPDPPLTLKGLVTQRALRELAVSEPPIVKRVKSRRYRIEAADAAQVLWRQHHPCKLYADKTIQDIINDQRNDLIQFEGTWSWASREPYKTPMVFLALDPSIGKASFYDWIMWYVDRFRLIWTYNCRTNTYSIVETKQATGDAIPVDWGDFLAPKPPLPDSLDPSLPPPYAPVESPPPYARVEPKRGVGVAVSGAPLQARYEGDFYEMYQRGYTVDAPPVPRYRAEVLDSFTAATKPRTPIDNPAAADTGMMRSTLLRTTLDDEVDQRVALERARLVPKPEAELSLHFSRIPVKPLFPGDVGEFIADYPGWSSDAWPVQQQLFRTYDVVLYARADDSRDGAWHRQPHATYELGYAARLEVARDVTTPRLPPFVEPTYPVYVEAKILSAIDGDDQSLTYDPRTQPTGLITYRVEVPLWKATAPEITAPYDPGRMPGQLFFPAYKHERVVLAMTWRKAWIDTFVSWRDGVRIPSDMQGNHMLLGKQPSSRTSVMNYYENQGSLLPIFEIARIHDVDRQKVVISEGNLLIEVNEDSTPLPAKVEDVSEDKQD